MRFERVFIVLLSLSLVIGGCWPSGSPIRRPDWTQPPLDALLLTATAQIYMPPATPTSIAKPQQTSPPVHVTMRLPTSTPAAPTPAQAHRFSATPRPPTDDCYAGVFIADVTVPDGTIMAPGQSFTKVWRVRNIGTCPWPQGTLLVHIAGEAFGVSRPVLIPGPVQPQAIVDIRVPMRAPMQPGEYTGHWLPRTPDGVWIEIGTEPPTTLWVTLSVKAPERE